MTPYEILIAVNPLLEIAIMIMYAVVNTFSKPHESFGRIESCHKTAENAEKARQEIWRKLSAGQYLPLKIVELRAKKKAGQSIPCSHYAREDGMWEHNENEPDCEIAELYRP